MNRLRIVLLALVLTACLSAHAQASPAYPNARPTDNPTALDIYIAKPDDNFHWELAKTEKLEGCTVHTLHMTSQAWRTKADVTEPLWKHWVAICVPDEVAHDTALLLLEGGSSSNMKNPAGVSDDIRRAALATRSVTATVYNLPNQGLYFTDQRGWSRMEDSLLAYGYLKFFQTGDPEWIIRLPMTKAAVRAMDSVQAFCASEAGGKHEINDFFVAGGSKRGWATWTSAIVDKRVTGIAPCAIDVLNWGESLKHHWESLGAWTLFAADYKALGVFDWLGTPEFSALCAIEDPHSYLDRLKMPKYIMYGANDQFFMPDTTQYWWNDLQGPKWLREIPNAPHWLDDSAYPAVSAFYGTILSEKPLPVYEFEFAPDGAIVVTLTPSADGTIVQPSTVNLWQAWNPKARDARGANAVYESSTLEPSGPNTYRATVTPKETGYQFYLVELVYPGPDDGTPLRFTSGCRVMPEEMPHKFKAKSPLPAGFLTKQ